MLNQNFRDMYFLYSPLISPPQIFLMPDISLSCHYISKYFFLRIWYSSTVCSHDSEKLSHFSVGPTGPEIWCVKENKAKLLKNPQKSTKIQKIENFIGFSANWSLWMVGNFIILIVEKENTKTSLSWAEPSSANVRLDVRMQF